MMKVRAFVFIALVIGVGGSASAQAVDPSGHWEGTLSIPDRAAPFSIDIARADSGEWIGAVTSAEVTNIPLTKITIAGRSIAFEARSDSPFTGELSADGRAMSGDGVLEGYELPFQLMRTGDARLVPPPTGAPVGKELEGTWEGMLDAGTRTLLVRLTIANTPDGRSRAHVTSVDEGGLIIPAVVTQSGSTVHVEQRGVPGSFSGVLNPAGTELAGNFAEGSRTFPLTLRVSK